MRFIYAAMWLAIFGVLGWMVHTGEAAAYSGRRGRFFTEMLTALSDKVGQTTVAIGLVLIGVAFAVWSLRGGDDNEGDDEASAS